MKRPYFGHALRCVTLVRSPLKQFIPETYHFGKARHDENMESLSEQALVPRLVELIQSKNMILQEAAAGALWNIAWGGSVGSQNDPHSIKHVINLLKSPNDNIVNCGSSILMNLTMADSEANRALVIGAGGAQALVEALETTKNSKVQYSVAGAISNLAVDNKLICRVFADLGALRPSWHLPVCFIVLSHFRFSPYSQVGPFASHRSSERDRLRLWRDLESSPATIKQKTAIRR